jgi:5-(carboxyamino)imidazole ribonucleotide synthase
VRTMTGAPLAEPRLHSPAVMLNLLGDLWFASGADAQDDRVREPDWARVLALPGVHLHLYGKATPRRAPQDGPPDAEPLPSVAEVRSVALQAAAILGLAAF